MLISISDIFVMQTKVEADLRTCHQISATRDDGDRVLLHRSGIGVTSEADVLEEDRVQRRRGEDGDGLRNVLASRLDRNVVIFFEVDTGVLLRGILSVAKELLLDAHVALSDNVLAVFPDTEPESLPGLGRRRRPVRGGAGAAPPSTSASARGRGEPTASAASSVRVAIRSTVTATGRRGRGAGISPAVSTEPMSQRLDKKKTKRNGTHWKGVGTVQPAARSACEGEHKRTL